MYHARKFFANYFIPKSCLSLYAPDYELGRLLVCSGDVEGGKTQLDLVYSGKPLEINAAGRKSKYSLEVRPFLPCLTRQSLTYSCFV